MMIAAPKRFIGWDIGGAYLKAALLEGQSPPRLVEAIKIPCRLWQGLGQLAEALNTACRHLGDADCHAITMTGELADIFPDRPTGVNHILDCAQAHLRQSGSDNPSPQMMIYSGGQDFFDPATARRHPQTVASANWQALAALTRYWLDDALIVDIGSTTTDIVILADRQLPPQGLSDHDRLKTAQLVYSGVIRTPLMALTQSIAFEGQPVALMAEIFATTADIYRLLGWLPPQSDLEASADGAGKTATQSARRLARMIGLDAASRPLDVWRQLAGRFADSQRNILHKACQRQLQQAAPTTPIIGYGCGQFLIKKIAASLGHPYIGGESLFGLSDPDLAARMAICGPAVGVAWLAATSFDR